MESMYGHAAFAYLRDIHQTAQQKFGWCGSLDDALHLLAELPDVIIQEAPVLGDYRVAAQDGGVGPSLT